MAYMRWSLGGIPAGTGYLGLNIRWTLHPMRRSRLMPSDLLPQVAPPCLGSVRCPVWTTGNEFNSFQGLAGHMVADANQRRTGLVGDDRNFISVKFNFFSTQGSASQWVVGLRFS